MADDKEGRDKQAHDQKRRQRERALKEERERSDEVEPVVAADEELGELLATHEYPATADELVDAFGDHAVESRSGLHTLEELLESVDEQSYDSAEEAKEHVQELIEQY